MKTILIAANLALLSMLAAAAPTPMPAVAAEPFVLTDVRWEALPPDGAGDAPRLGIQYRRSNSDVAIDGSRPEFAEARAALGGSAGPLSFSVVHEAGTLACSGRLERAWDGEGTCRFTADPGFESALAGRGIALERRDETLAMLMVDATIALADGLAGAGLKLDESDNLIAAAALHVTPAYVRDLRDAPLAIDAVDDAIACRALGVDGAYVRGLVAAGYAGLTTDQVVSMKALGVTPDYARGINAAAAESGQ